MPRTDVLALAQLFAANEADEAMLERYYTDAIRDLAQNTGHLTNISLVTGVKDQSVYTAPSKAVRILSTFYGQSELWAETYTGLASAASPTWRERSGDPVSYTTLDVPDRSIRLYPTPNRAGEAFLPLTGLFGASYPDYNVFIAHTEERADAPVYLDLYLTFTILAREFARDSAHQDMGFSAACSGLAAMCLAVVN